jgi:hypothetical protein
MQGVQEGAVKTEEVLVVVPGYRMRWNLFPLLTLVTLYMYFTFCAKMADKEEGDPRARLVLVAAASAMTVAAMWMFRESERDFFRRRNEKHTEP